MNRVNDPDKMRQIIIDRELFKEFANDCYLKQNRVERLDQITCSIKPQYDKIEVDCVNIEWIAVYWANAPYNKYPDPFEQHEGGQMWGYTETEVVTKITCSRKPIDDVYTRNFYSNKRIKV